MRYLLPVLMLPAMVVIVVPAFILYFSGQSGPGCQFAPLLKIPLSVVSLAAGITLMIKTNLLFVRVGEGTLAPWDPPKKLVVRGIYRNVRNPMITGVLCILFAEAVWACSLPLLSWCCFFWLANLLYLPLVEEPKLAERFGADYLEYKRNVPRWIPRLKPWESGSNQTE